MYIILLFYSTIFIFYFFMLLRLLLSIVHSLFLARSHSSLYVCVFNESLVIRILNSSFTSYLFAFYLKPINLFIEYIYECEHNLVLRLIFQVVLIIKYILINNWNSFSLSLTLKHASNILFSVTLFIYFQISFW